MAPTLAQVQDARKVIAGSAIRTPLVRLNLTDGPAEVYLKLENLQPIGSFKIRGAANAMGHMSLEQLSHGVLTASAGNMAQGVAWCARNFGIQATIIAPDTAPATKIEAIHRFGGRVLRVPFDEWWETFERRSYPGVDGLFIHAFDDVNVMAGNGTIGLEILEDLPEVDAIVVPWGGGGLACGVASAVRAMEPSCRIYAAEVATAAPLAASLTLGAPATVEYQRSFVDGIGGRTVFPQMFEMARTLIAASLVCTLEEVGSAVRLLAERNRIVAEGAGACPVAAALAGRVPFAKKVVCIVSGGNIDLAKLRELLN